MSNWTLRAGKGARISGSTLLIAFGAAILSTVVAYPISYESRATVTILSSSLVLATVALLGVQIRDVVLSVILAAGLGIGCVTLTPLLLTSGLIAVLLATVAEEILYRGYCFGRLKRVVGVPGAIIVSSLLFAAMHFNPDQFLRQFSLGVVLALLYKVTDRLPIVTAAHLIHNLLVLATR